MINEASKTSLNIIINSAIIIPFFIENESQFKEIIKLIERILLDYFIY